MKQLICLSDEPWSLLPGRAQQLVTRLKDTQVLFFEPPRTSHGKGRHVLPNVVAYPLPPRSLLPFSRVYSEPQYLRRAARYIKNKCDKRRFRRPLLWVTSPEHQQLLDRLTYSILVYDCCRSWSDFPEIWESDLTTASDVTFAASPRLSDHLAPCGANVALLPCGSTSAAFSRKHSEVPGPLRGISGPILCHMGPVNENLDISPLLSAAASHPEWTVLFLGPVQGKPADFHRLCGLCRVVNASPDSLVEYPDYVAASSICIKLLYRDEPAACILPESYYNALSSGKPMAVLLAPEQPVLHPDAVESTYTAEKFGALCEHALLDHSEERALLRCRYGAEADWNRRAESAAQILEALGF